MTPQPGDAPPKASSQLSPDEAIDNFLLAVPEKCRLLVAFSGGGDSTGLLAALAEARRSPPGLSLHAATVDHGLRSGSVEEARAAAQVSASLGVPHSVLQWSGEKPATGIQAAARAARYGLLASEARRIGADLIVTGHTFDDQLETVAMRQLRNPSGEVGMDAAVLVERSVWVVRPLLAVGRQSDRSFLEKKHLSWSEDPSNANPAFERVRIRRGGIRDDMPLKSPDRASSVTGAQFVRDHVKLHSTSVVAVGLTDFDVRYKPHWLVLTSLISIVGGREHGLGAEAADRVATRIAAGENFRCTAGRVVIDRRKTTLYLCREGRGLPTVTIMPDEMSLWDGRYEIANAGTTPMVVAAGDRAGVSVPLVPLPANSSLPGSVARLAGLSAPHMIEGDISKVVVRPVLAPFEKFLPRHRFELANGLAEAFGLELFPRLPLCISPFNT